METSNSTSKPDTSTRRKIAALDAAIVVLKGYAFFDDTIPLHQAIRRLEKDLSVLKGSLSD